MGHKLFKEKFNIEHNVHIENNHLLIGSPLCSDLVRIDINTGKIIKDGICRLPGERGFLEEYYPSVLNISDQERRDIILKEDTFEKSIDVFTYKYGVGVVKKQAEKFGYPNRTHDGEIMYENNFFKTYEEALDYGINEISISVKWEKQEIQEKEKSLLKSKKNLEKYSKHLKELKKEKSKLN